MTGDEVGAGGEFEWEPEDEDGEEIERRRTRDVARALLSGTDHRHGHVEQHETVERQAGRARKGGGSGEDRGEEEGGGPDAAGMSMKDVPQRPLPRAAQQSQDGRQQQRREPRFAPYRHLAPKTGARVTQAWLMGHGGRRTNRENLESYCPALGMHGAWTRRGGLHAMRNWSGCSGVYSGMVRVPLLVLYSLTALAQPGPRQDPMDAAIDAVWRARSMSRYSEADAGWRRHARSCSEHR